MAVVDNGREVAAFICSHVFRNERPVLLVSRATGDWMFLCGGSHPSGELPHLVGCDHLFERDQRLREVADLEPNWDAERQSIEGSWVRTPSPAEDAEGTTDAS